MEDLKPRLLGHFGTTPGQNFIYVHCNRIIRERGLDMIYVSGPGHGGPAVVANVYLEGTYSEEREDFRGSSSVKTHPWPGWLCT
jgi:xylulose-5-phosphate/fructose-6-phosphate phosphoketolase